jgi:hypothetical protein
MALAAPETRANGTGRPSGKSGRSGSSLDPDFAEAEGAGATLARFVAALEAERYSGDDSVTLVTFFTRMERLCGAGKALAARRVEEARSHLRSGHRSTAELLAARTGDSLGEAKDLLRLGGHLSDQPTLDQALRDGRLSKRRAALVAEAAKVNPDKEAELVDGATHDSEARFKERCLRAKAQGRSPEEEARHHQRLHERRRCRTFTDTDGAFRLDALLPPEVGAEVRSALEAHTDRFFRRARQAGVYEPPDAYAADALVDLVCRRGAAGPTDSTGTDSTTGTGTGTGPPVRTRAPRTTLFIRCDLGALRRGHVAGDELCEIPGVGPVPVPWVHEQLGEALCHLVVTDGVDVTTLYSPGRHIPLPVKAALLERDSRCVVPGCDARLGLENDHWARDFAQGGPTALDNLARVCHHHHQLRTHRGFQLTGGPGRWRWTAPEHPVVPARPRPKKRRPRAPAPPPKGPRPPRFTDRE